MRALKAQGVIWVVESGSICGGVRVIFEMASRLRKRGWNIAVASLNRSPDWFPLDDIRWNVFMSYEHMVKALKDVDAKKIATWWKTARPTADASKEGQGYYLVQDIESSYYYRHADKDAVISTYYDLPLKKFSELKAASDYLGIPCVGVAYDPSMYRPLKYIAKSPDIVLSLARKQALKGWCDLGELSRVLAKKNAGVKLVTFGPDPHIGLIGAHQAHISKMSDAGIVEMYNSAACYVCTSHWEGFGLPMLEAMACGTPVVTTDCHGNYFCENGVNCIKVPKGDVQGLADGVIEVVRNRELSDRLVQAGYETAKTFSDWNRVIDNLEQLLAS